jgi:Short C-terminal domain
MGKRFGPRIAIIVAVLSMVASIIGLVASIVLNAFVFDEYDAYGEVPVPGSRSLQLPAGEVTVSFHTVITGRPAGGGLPIPELKMGIDPPPGVGTPQVTESIGGTTTVNSDAHVRVWLVQIPEAGTYTVRTDGNVGGYISPRLAFGHGSTYGWLWWLFGGLLVLSIVELVAALIWSAKSAKRARPLAPEELLDQPTWDAGPTPSSYTPTADGVRIEQLKSLAALRDSGALTEAEFEAEKRRILDWGPS